MLIIAGHLVVDPTERDRVIAGHVAVVTAALAAPGCLDFAVTADTIDPARVRIYERWEDEEQLLAFRGSGPDQGQQDDILDVEVRRYEISSVMNP